MTDKEYFDKVWKEDMAPRYGCTAYVLCLLLAACFTVCLLSSCKTEYIPIETVRVEYQNHTDTVKETDSIFKERETIVRETNKGDSALLARLGIQLKENERAILILRKELEAERSSRSASRTDTIIKTDTIQVPVPIEGKVKTTEKVGLLTIGAACGLGIVAAWWLLRWIRRRYKRT